jgi:hypothetical protein
MVDVIVEEVYVKFHTDFYHTAWHQIPEASCLHSHCCEKLNLTGLAQE